ncbi:nucleotidyltransferase domain-containing protein [Streptomyces sp. IBSBF 2953]|nr:nucleotidyltransferase domain-containing protein [Streptomyces hayashii]
MGRRVPTLRHRRCPHAHRPLVAPGPPRLAGLHGRRPRPHRPARARRTAVTLPSILLSGIVGSTAYGLDRPGSDVDRLGIFAAPTEQLHGLQRPVESHVTTSPDRTLHEAAKWCRLALSGNPTVMELVWLPAELYEVRCSLGDDLIRIRSAFLSAQRVRDAYLGYATQQFRRLESRGDGSFSADTRKRTAKHARHLKRLCHQGLELYTTGRLTVRVEDPETYHAFGERVAADAAAARPLLADYETAFDTNRSALPDRPDEAAVELWLRRVRAHFYESPVESA